MESREEKVQQIIETCILFFPFVGCVTQLSHSDCASSFPEVKLVIQIFSFKFFF